VSLSRAHPALTDSAVGSLESASRLRDPFSFSHRCWCAFLAPPRRYLGNGPAEFHEYYMHAALVVEPPPQRVLRFSLGGDELAEDVKVAGDPAPDETMREVIDCAVRYDRNHRLFRDPSIAAALAQGPSSGGSEATLSLHDFLDLTTEALVGRFSPDADPICIRVMASREESADGEDPETRSIKIPKLS
jgi:hypothetical protein